MPPHSTTTASPPKYGTAHSSPHSSIGWGRSFKVEWIQVGRLPFAKQVPSLAPDPPDFCPELILPLPPPHPSPRRTRHITNPFNQGREVKVSRDGTEVEPRAGQELIRAWDGEDAGGAGASSGMARAASSQ